MTHSPFPWTHRTQFAVFDATGKKIAATTEGHAFHPAPRQEAEDNAALIAAIPDMVEALEAALDCLSPAAEAIAEARSGEIAKPVNELIAKIVAALAAYRSQS